MKWAGNYNFSWSLSQDKKYVDGSALGFGYVAERGVAIENALPGQGRILFFASAKDLFNTSNTGFIPFNGLTGGVSKRASFFDEAQLMGGYLLQYDTFEDGGTEVRMLELSEDPSSPRAVEGMLLQGLSRAEHDTLKALPGFNSDHPTTIKLEALAGSPFTDSNGKIFHKFKTGLQGLDQNGNAKKAFPTPDINVFSKDNLFFFSGLFSSNQPLPIVYIRNYEEAIGEMKRGIRHLPVFSVDTGAKKFVIEAIDLTKEIFVGGTVTIKDSNANNGNYTVNTVSFVSGKTEIVVNEAIPSNALSLGDLHEPEIPFQDFFIKKDIAGVLGTVGPMSTIVEDFITQISAVPDSPAGLAQLDAKVVSFGDKILQRARATCSNNSKAYADDRPLYWARNKMAIALKSHPQLLKSLTERNRLTKLFEANSRGFNSIDFSSAGTKKKVLISGFDPFFLHPTKAGNNIYQSNPSGAAALALHGQTLSGSPNVFIQSAIFPVRYQDFDQNGGLGIVEKFFDKFINPSHPQTVAVDMIITLSQGRLFQFDLEHYASRHRGGGKDNLNKPAVGPPSFKFPTSVAGDEFYQTTLPHGKFVQGNTPALKYQRIHNEDYSYQNPSTGNNIGTLVTNDTSKAPNTLTLTTTPKLSEIKSREGSGGDYLSNEIFYRVSRLRKNHNPALKTGHYHVPLIQYGTPLPVPRTGAQYFSTVKFDAGNTKDLINDIEAAILRAVAP